MKGLGASERVFGLLQRKPMITSPVSATFNVQKDYGNIKFDDVSFAYPSRLGAKVLRGFSMTIKGKGDSVAIVCVYHINHRQIVLKMSVCCDSGKSGSGKSSVQSLLFRFYDPDSGTITVNGRGKQSRCCIVQGT